MYPGKSLVFFLMLILVILFLCYGPKPRQLVGSNGIVAKQNGNSTKTYVDPDMGKESKTMSVSTLHEITEDKDNSKKYNILLIGADDLRPEFAPLSDTNPDYHQGMFTPSFNTLAQESLLFKHAYSQYSKCDASRSSMMTSRRPDTTRVYSHLPMADLERSHFVTLPQYFRQKGYRTAGLGKIFHHGTSQNYYAPRAWSEPTRHDHSNASSPWQKNRELIFKAVNIKKRQAFPLPDEESTQNVIDVLQDFASSNNSSPFFLAVGFMKPHFPLIFPAEHLKYYPIASVKTATRRYAPKGVPSLVITNSSGLLRYDEIREYAERADNNADLLFTKAKQIRQAYYTTVTYIDSLLGKIISTLKDVGFYGNTIIVFWADHGFHLGENGMWGKSTVYEMGTHVPLLIRIPGLTDSGMQTANPVELVDVFPTLVDAAGLPPVPLCKGGKLFRRERLCTEGSSLFPIFLNSSTPWKTGAFSQKHKKVSKLMGYSLRTSRYRYTEWVQFDATETAVEEPDWSTVKAEELYDYHLDPTESANWVNDSNYRSVKEDLKAQLHGGWRKTLDVVGQRS